MEHIITGWDDPTVEVNYDRKDHSYARYKKNAHGRDCDECREAYAETRRDSRYRRRDYQ